MRTPHPDRGLAVGALPPRRAAHRLLHTLSPSGWPGPVSGGPGAGRRRCACANLDQPLPHHWLLLSDTYTRIDQSWCSSAAGSDGVVNEELLKGLRPKCRRGVAGARLPTYLLSPGSHLLESEVQACNSYVQRYEETSRFKTDSCRDSGRD